MTPDDVRISLIVAADENETIGRDGALPWHLPEDLKRFRSITTGHVVVAGRLTQDSIVARLGRALPDRVTVVVTRSMDQPAMGSVHYRQSVESALGLARELEAARGNDEVFVIGGAEVYRQALPHVQRVYLTRVHATVGGDREMPAGWLEPFGEAADRDQRVHGDLPVTFETYERR